jgi:ribose-phosphate pyrophosphokinase
LSGFEVSARGVVGSVRGLSPILVDDMISTAATLSAAAEVLLEAGCRPEFTVAATHGLLCANALERLSKIPLQRLLLTDSLPRPAAVPAWVEELSVAPLLSQAMLSLCV